MSGYFPAGVTQNSFDCEMEGLGYREEPEDGTPAMNFTVNIEPFYTNNGAGWQTQWSVEVTFDCMEAEPVNRLCKTRAEAEMFIGETIMNWAEGQTQ